MSLNDGNHGNQIILEMYMGLVGWDIPPKPEYIKMHPHLSSGSSISRSQPLTSASSHMTSACPDAAAK